MRTSGERVGLHSDSGPGPRSGPVGSAVRGFWLLFEAVSLLRRHRALWVPAAIPVGLSGLALLTSLGLLVEYAGEIYGFAAGRLPVFEAEGWLSWLWVGPAKLAMAMLAGLFFALVAAVGVVAGLAVANVLASPFLDILSRRVEQIVTGRIEENEGGGVGDLLRDALRAIGNELQRLFFFALVWLALLAVGIALPAGQVVAPPALLLVTLVFLPLDYSGYALDRRRLSFRTRRAWILSNLPTMLGFGTAALLLLWVPGLNLLMLPALVTGGTLLALRWPPAPQPARPS